MPGFQTVVVERLSDYVQLVSDLFADVPSGLVVPLRGQAAPWPLMSALGRFVLDTTGDEARARQACCERELKMLRHFQEAARPWTADRPDSDIQWLMLAQHHGLPTRLLDWTSNPLVALYFAVDHHVPSEPTPPPGIVWIANPPTEPLAFGHELHDWSLERLQRLQRGEPLEDAPHLGAVDLAQRPYVFVTAPTFSPRIPAQCALFSLHLDPLETLDSHQGALSTRIEVPDAAKDAIRRELADVAGLTPQTLYPGLEGLAATVKQRWR